MPKKLLSGNEAFAWGFRDAGGHFAAAYPGTPSTEILETIARFEEVYAQWSPNEKSAFETAFGASMAGARALVAMKHVGLNVAADPLFTSAYTGVNGGFVIITADDPSMHSSQNEQDNRMYAPFAKLPLLEPSTPQEAYDFVGIGLELSEKYDIPVLLRSETRLSHGKAIVLTRERKDVPMAEPDLRWEKYVMMPINARVRRADLAERLRALAEFSETGPLNRIEPGDKNLGIISSGVSYLYAREVFPEASFLKLGMSFPFPEKLVRRFAEEISAGGGEIYIVEELDPFIEMRVRALGIPCHGKDKLPEMGEFSPQVIRQGILGETLDAVRAEGAPSRPPNLCPGCPHTSVFFNLHRLGAHVFGDIGCYTLGALPPLSAINTCICMGASVTNAFGFSKARAGTPEAQKAVAVLGDSTFFHGGLPGVIDMVYNKGVDTLVVLDNRTTAMTGHQVHPGSGKTLKGEDTIALVPEDVVRALGVEHVQVVDTYDIKATRNALKQAMEHDGPSVVVARRPCVLLPEERKRWAQLPKYMVLEDRCAGEKCGLCLRLGCPAIFKTQEGKARIDRVLCTSCGLCAQVCPKTYHAIVLETDKEVERVG